MDEIKIGAEIVFNITGNHNIGYAKGEKVYRDGVKRGSPITSLCTDNRNA